MLYQLLTASNLVRATSEDLPSQMNHVWTSTLLAGLGLLVSLVQYVGDPIQCWCPAHMPEVHCNYTKAMCWIKQSYFVDIDNPLPHHKEDRHENEVTYYPWVPWILFFMAAMFKWPHITWLGVAPNSDFDLQKYVEIAEDDGDAVQLATILRVWLLQAKFRRRQKFHNTKKILGALGVFWLGRHKNSFLTGLCIFIKLIYLIVSLCMFMSLKLFIDNDFLSYGWDTARDFLNGVAIDSTKFPKETFCDLNVRQMSNVNTYTVQCILPINLYNQKIFLFLWYWFVVMMTTNLYSLLHWCFNLLSPSRRYKLVNDYTIIMDHIEKNKDILGISYTSSCDCSKCKANNKYYDSKTDKNNNNSTSSSNSRTLNSSSSPLAEDNDNKVRRRRPSTSTKKRNTKKRNNKNDIDDNNSNDNSNDLFSSSLSSLSAPSTLLNFDNDSNNNDNNNNNNNNDNNINNSDASLLTVVGLDIDGTKLQVGKHVNFLSPEQQNKRNRKKKKNKKPKKTKNQKQDGGDQNGENQNLLNHPNTNTNNNNNVLLPSIEVAYNDDDNDSDSDDNTDNEQHEEKRRLLRQSAWMYQQLDYDGVFVFRVLELAVGVVVANDVFRQLFIQLEDALHHSNT